MSFKKDADAGRTNRLGPALVVADDSTLGNVYRPTCAVFSVKKAVELGKNGALKELYANRGVPRKWVCDGYSNNFTTKKIHFTLKK